MKNRIIGLSVVFSLVLLLVAPIAARALPLPGWVQRNASGFGTVNNQVVAALTPFNGQLYAGTANAAGAQVWRTADGSTWTPANTPGFASIYAAANGVIFGMVVFNGWLYAGTGSWAVHGVAGQIWRSADGSSWQRVTGGWEANANNAGITNFAIFGNRLYAATFNPNGLQIWSSGTGNSNDWVQVATNIVASSNHQESTGLTVFNGYLYAAVEGQPNVAGAQVWRTSDGVSWSNVVLPSGFGSLANYQTGGWGTFGGYLYVGTRNDTTGGQLWRSQDGTTWTPVVTNGFGSTTNNPNNNKVEGLTSALGLFAFVDNSVTGAEVWRSTDGVTWQQANVNGFGTANNRAVALWSNGAAFFVGQWFLGTWNQPNGGQVWSLSLAPSLPNKLYLPAVQR